jgi:CheY-like chemotaxis protein
MSGRDIPIIFITAHGSDDGERARALRDGAVAYLTKPFSEGALLEAVTAALSA